MTDNVTAALYLRTAAESDEAIAEQHRICLEHAAAQGWRIGDVFVDNGRSGVRDRPGLQAVRHYVQNGRDRIVLAMDPSRIFRDHHMLADFQRFCAAHGAQIAYVHDPVNFSAVLRAL